MKGGALTRQGWDLNDTSRQKLLHPVAPVVVGNVQGGMVVGVCGAGGDLLKERCFNSLAHLLHL